MVKEYVVGIDFGHGETAAWIVPLAEDTQIEGSGESLKLRKSNKPNERTLPSVVYKNKQSKYFLERLESSVIISELKGRPSSLSSQKREAYGAYIRLVVERLISANKSFLHQDEDGNYNFYLYIACPTRWDNDDRNEYYAFVNQSLSTLGIAVEWVINESDAAYFTYRPPKESSEQRVLVIDYGSSTIDYTLMDGPKKISDDGWSNPQLGASNIENAILQYYETKYYADYQRCMNGQLLALSQTGNGSLCRNITSR